MKDDSFFSSQRVHMRKDLPVWVEKAPQMQNVVHHSHEFIEIVFVASGSAMMEHTKSGGFKRQSGLIPGDIFAILPNEGHSYRDCENLVLYNIYVLPRFINNYRKLRELSAWKYLFDESGKTGKRVLSLPGTIRQNAIRTLDQAVYECRVRPAGFAMMVKALILKFLIEACRAINPEQQELSESEPDILKSLRVIENDPASAHPLEELAAISRMSISSYTRKFRKITGLSAQEYILKRRMQLVCSYLTDSDRNIAEIAELTGFCTPNYLIKMFRRLYGMTPMDYRKTWNSVTLPFSEEL
jgi:AraC-like DNA-binding protein